MVMDSSGFEMDPQALEYHGANQQAQLKKLSNNTNEYFSQNANHQI
jgi:hypothetical protein